MIDKMELAEKIVKAVLDDDNDSKTVKELKEQLFNDAINKIKENFGKGLKGTEDNSVPSFPNIPEIPKFPDYVPYKWDWWCFTGTTYQDTWTGTGYVLNNK